MIAMADASALDSNAREIDEQRKKVSETLQTAQALIAANLPTTVVEEFLRMTVGSASVSEHATSTRSADTGAAAQRGSAESFLGRHQTGFHVPMTSGSIAGSDLDDDGDGDGDDDLFVQEQLQSESFDLEGMRRHIRSYKWEFYDEKIMHGVVGNPARLSETPLIPNQKGKLEDGSDRTHYQVFNIGRDGSPLAYEFLDIERTLGRPAALWHAVKDIKPTNGRITILREPSPILFGAIHYTMNGTFDMSELLRLLYENLSTSASMERPFEEDERRQRSHVFSFAYFTLLGKDCEPMVWQMATSAMDRVPGALRISQCNCVVALQLSGSKIKEIKNHNRQGGQKRGSIYDPFSPWQVLSIECCPDYKSQLDVHETNKHYVSQIAPLKRSTPKK